MRILRIKGSNFFIDKVKKKGGNGKSRIEPFCKPVFPFVGNKSNRRDLIVSLLETIFYKLFPETPKEVFDVFGGSFYLSHLVQIVATRMRKHIVTYTNDYDNYSCLFSPKTMEHLLWYKSVCDSHPELKRNELLPDEDCQKIDDYTNRYCPYLDQWVIRFLTNYGASRHYRKRLTDYQTFWKGVSLPSYIPNTIMTLDKTDWKKWMNWIISKKVCDKTKPSLWLVDPPYTTYNTGIYYGDGFANLNISAFNVVMKILNEFPNAYVLTFGYVRNFSDHIKNFPDNVHYDELNEYWPACQGLRIRSRPEYIHIWYTGKKNRSLDELIDIEPLVDKRNHRHVRADGKKPNLDTWKYDSKFGRY